MFHVYSHFVFHRVDNEIRQSEMDRSVDFNCGTWAIWCTFVFLSFRLGRLQRRNVMRCRLIAAETTERDRNETNVSGGERRKCSVSNAQTEREAINHFDSFLFSIFNENKGNVWRITFHFFQFRCVQFHNFPLSINSFSLSLSLISWLRRKLMRVHAHDEQKQFEWHAAKTKLKNEQKNRTRKSSYEIEYGNEEEEVARSWQMAITFTQT